METAETSNPADAPKSRSGHQRPAARAKQGALSRLPVPSRLKTPGVRKALLPIFILLLAVAFAGYLRATKPPVQRTEVKERVWFVQTVPVSITTITPQLKLYGEIVAGQEVELRPLVSGRVVKLGESFADGGIVKKGEMLVTIDPFDYAADVAERNAQLAEARAKLKQFKEELSSEKAQIASDKLQIGLRERDVLRRENLRKRGAGSEKSLDDSRMALTDQRKQLAVRRKTIATLESRIVQQEAAITRAEVALRRAQRNFEETRLTAPFAGFLRDISTSLGKRVATNDRIARLIDAGWLEARFQISDDEYGRLIAAGPIKGMTAEVIWRTRAKTFTYEAAIERTSGRVESGSGGIHLFARIKNTDVTTVLRPGVFVEVRIKDRGYKNVVRLPDGALHGEDTVYAVVGGRLQARKVDIVARTGSDVLVRGALKAGDKVVANIFAEIGPGVKVEIR
ncbi:MAG: efflux RND transporter periplasmic adaptor subunit [Pseudomonadota bacterium]